MTATTVTGSRLPAPALYELLSGAWVARMVSLLAELDVADAISADTGSTVPEIAAATGTDADALHRVLRALAAKGVLGYDSGSERYSHTEISAPLRRDHPASVHGLALIAGAAWQWRAWSLLPAAVRTGGSPFAEAHGKPLWEYFAEDDPAAGFVFQQAMGDLSRRTDLPVAAAIDVGEARTVV
nr:hypothetical protein [Micromonospora sp. DSM 115978]